MKKPRHIQIIKVEASISETLVKLEVYHGSDFIGKFYISPVSLDSKKQIPGDILKSRMKHDFDITFDAYTYQVVPSL